MYIEKSVLWPDRKHPVLSQGRNGNIQTKGLVLCTNEFDMDIMPLTTKNKVGNCIVCLPADPVTIRHLAAILMEVAAEVEAKHD
jgi:hypothetical protein